tara:strand:- start:581 stop:1675 length:1095 start_codon:yes stop_codon:yes gene_type:complete
MNGLNNPIGYKSTEPLQKPFIMNPFRFGGAEIGGWVELGRTTLGIAGDTISVTSLADKRYYMVLNYTLATGGLVNGKQRLNGDSGTNYAVRLSNDGAGDVTAINDTTIFSDYSSAITPSFNLNYLANLATEEKLSYGWSVSQSTAGAANSPHRAEFIGKHAQTTNPISQIDWDNTAGGSFDIGSEVVVLGFDPSDDDTGGFWQELASVTQSGAGSSLDSGTIIPKKYLWIQTFNPDKPSGNNLYYKFNNSTGSDYANRYSTNGGADVTQPSVGNGIGCNYDPAASGTTAGLFMNTFIINNLANEKLCTTNTVSGWTNAGAGVAPATFHVSSKWANTSAQITSVQYNGTTNSVSDGTIMKVWGSN